MTDLVPTTSASEASIIDELLAAAHELARLGLSPGASGNVSIRVDDRIYLSATGASLADLDRESLAVLDAVGTHISGPAPTKEAALHLAFYDRDPTAVCVVHLHSTNAVAASCLTPHSRSSALPAITPYFVMRVGQTPLIPYAAPGAADHALAISRHQEPFRAALLQNHGSIVTGTTVSTAAQAAIELEEACSILLRLPPSGYQILGNSEARALAQRYGSYWSADD